MPSYVVTICRFVAVPTSCRNYRGTTKISCYTSSASSSARERILPTAYHRLAMLTRHHWLLTCHTTLWSISRVPSLSSWTRPEMKRTASPWCWPVQQMAGNHHPTSYSSGRRSRKWRGRRESSSVARTKGGWTRLWRRTGSRQFGANDQVAWQRGAFLFSTASIVTSQQLCCRRSGTTSIASMTTPSQWLAEWER